MKNNKRIGIDIDEVVIEFFRRYLKLFNSKFNKKLDFEDLVNYHIWEIIDISREDALTLAHEVHISENQTNTTLVKGVREALFRIVKEYDIYFITSRPEEYKEIMTKTLKESLNNLDFKLLFSSGVWEHSKTKGEICKELGIKIMIEDNASYALTCAQKGVKTFLLEKPWNKSSKGHENIIRVKSWNEILNHLETTK